MLYHVDHISVLILLLIFCLHFVTAVGKMTIKSLERDRKREPVLILCFINCAILIRVHLEQLLQCHIKNIDARLHMFFPLRKGT